MDEPLHSQGSESLEDRIRRMAHSHTATQNSSNLGPRPVVRLPSTTSYESQPSLPPTLDCQGHFPHFPPGLVHGYAQSPERSIHTHPRHPMQRPGYLANNQSLPSHHMPVRGNASVAGQPVPFRGRGGKRQGPYQQFQIDPDAYQRVTNTQGSFVQTRSPQPLYDPAQPRLHDRPHWKDIRAKQAQYLDGIAMAEVPLVEMSDAERSEKESFRDTLESVCHEIYSTNPQRSPQVSLECFGSFQSGFASAGSDMDLVIVVKNKDSESACFSLLADDLPRELEQRLLQRGFGARLLTRTRVPIIKVCQSPGASLLDKLREERENWDMLPNEKKYPHLHPEDNEARDDNPQVEHGNEQEIDNVATTNHEPERPRLSGHHSNPVEKVQVTEVGRTDSLSGQISVPSPATGSQQQARSKKWVRERRAGPLDFPKTGVGIQSDINFFNPLGLHNTQMLRCYSLCDRRVRPMVLFVKAWAKRRRINSSYSGTLSSYGYVLMVLHYLINVVRPPVLPNLQLAWRPAQDCTPHGASSTEVDGWIVDFWRNESEIINAENTGQLTTNRESIGSLLAGFFVYYSSLGGGYQFRWTTQILSLRTPQGILTKEEKGWVKATMEQGEGKQIQHRYLFCIEDPFELSHNVARTVTHNGIVAIRDEFRRAFRILDAVARSQPGDASDVDDLFHELVERPATPELPPNLQDKPVDGQKPMLTASQSVPATQSGKAQPSQLTEQVQSSRAKLYSKRVQGQSSQITSPTPEALDVTDNDVFPTLSAAKSKPRKKAPAQRTGEISGERAKALLEKIREKKDAQTQARTTLPDTVSDMAK